MFLNSAFLCVSLVLFPTVSSWGNLGHEITGKVAQKFLSQTAEENLKYILHESHGDLGSVASWADKVKDDPAYVPWSYPLHYASPASDEGRCGLYNDERDCFNDNCVVGALTKYTQLAKCIPGVQPSDDPERAIALKFVIHFLGDLAQPLHVSNRDRGGTRTYVKYGRRLTNLHAVWDTNLIVSRLYSNHKGSIDAYVQDLVDKISGGIYVDDSPSWLSNHSIETKSLQGRYQAVIDWAQESSSIACDIAWPEYDNLTEDQKNLRGQYYTNAVDVADRQLAKAGYRMAYWLNHLFESHDCLPTSDVRPQTHRKRPPHGSSNDELHLSNFADQSYLPLAPTQQDGHQDSLSFQRHSSSRRFRAFRPTDGDDASQQSEDESRSQGDHVRHIVGSHHDQPLQQAALSHQSSLHTQSATPAYYGLPRHGRWSSSFDHQSF